MINKTEEAQSAETGPTSVEPSVTIAAKTSSPVIAKSAAADEVKFSFLRHIVLPGIILAVGLGGLIGSSKLKKDPPKKEIPLFIPNVKTVTVEPFSGTLTMDLDGTVVPLREVSIATEVVGRIKYKSPDCRAGNFVTQGTLLFEIDAVDFELEVKRLQQEVAQAEIGIDEIDVELNNYRELMELAAEDRNLQLREVERLKSLVSNRVVTESELDRALGIEVTKRNSLQALTNQVKTMIPRRASLVATVGLAKTRLEKAQLDLQRTKITAPVDGIVIDDLVEVNSFVTRGATLTNIEDTSAIEVQCNLRSDQLFWLWAADTSDMSSASLYELPHAKARVIFRVGGREYEWDATLSRYEGSGIDEQTRTVPCRLLVDNPTEVRIRNESPGMQNFGKPPALVRGMFVAVEIETDTSAELLRIPLAARQLGGTVWLAKDGRLQIETVKIAKQLPDAILVYMNSTIVRPGDELIITPIAKVKDGMEISVEGDETGPLAEGTSPQKESIAL